MYTYNDDDAVKHCYDVYVRISATAGVVGSGYFSPTDPAWDLSGFNVSTTTPGAEGSILVYKDENATVMYSTIDACWCKIGVLDTEPTLVTSEGEKIPLATCNDKVISKKVEIDFTSLSVNKDNWDQMIALIASNVDVLFVETGSVTTITEGNGIGAANMQMDVNLEIKGNAPNRMPFKISKEVGTISKFVNFVTVQST